MTLSLIAAMSANRAIGRDNRLPWRLRADLRRFKELTMGHCLIMGRKTFESLGRPLPGRTIVVITRQRDYAPEGVLVAHSVEDALNRSRGEEVFVAGGAQIYEQTIGRADRLYLTVIEKEYEGDAFFPLIDESRWRLVGEERHAASEGSPGYRYLTYERAGAGQS